MTVLLLLQVFSQWPMPDPTPTGLSSSFARPKLTGKQHSGNVHTVVFCNKAFLQFVELHKLCSSLGQREQRE